MSLPLKDVTEYLIPFGKIKGIDLFVPVSDILTLIAFGKLLKMNSNEILENFTNNKYFALLKDFRNNNDDIKNAIVYGDMEGIEFEFNDERLKFAKEICEKVSNKKYSVSIALCLFMIIEENGVTFRTCNRDGICKFFFYDFVDIHPHTNTLVENYIATYGVFNNLVRFRLHDDWGYYYTFDDDMELKEHIGVVKRF
jgi:hypothetical protein